MGQGPSIAVAILFVTAPCHAISVLDQSYSAPLSNFVLGGCCWAAQTFTVGVGGTLTQVSIDLYDLHPTPWDSPKLQILRTVSGTPTKNPVDVLATVYLPENISDPQRLTVDVSSFDIGVSVGDVLAIAIDASFHWHAGLVEWGQSYVGGMSWVGQFEWSPRPNLDLEFQTFVNVPEPGTLALLSLGLLGLGVTRRKA